MRVWFMSKPTTSMTLPNSTANGRPTYPRPMTPILSILFYVIVFFVPVDKPSHTGFDGRSGTEVHCPEQVFHISIRFGYVAVLQVHVLSNSLLSQLFLNDLNKTDEGDRLIIADVINAIRGEACSGIRCFSIPIRIGSRWLFDETRDRLNDVVDIGEVATHLAVVVNIYRFAFEYRFGEYE